MKTFYFAHDYNARNDSKLLIARSKGGLEVVGAYWQIIEVLHESNNALSWTTDDDFLLVAVQLGVTVEKLKTLIAVLVNTRLVTVEDGFLSSIRVGHNLNHRSKKSNQAREAALKRYQHNQLPSAAAERPSAPALPEHAIKGNKIKGNKIKEKDIKENKNKDNKNIITTKPKLNFGEEGKVLLTAEELDKLVSKYGKQKTQSAIELLNDYVGSQKKDPYSSHYHALKRWVFAAVDDRANKKNKFKPWTAADTYESNLEFFKMREDNANCHPKKLPPISINSEEEPTDN